MKKNLIFGAALMFACAFGFQSCSNEDNVGTPTQEPIVGDIQRGNDLSTLIEKYAVDGVLTLPAGAQVAMSQAIETTSALTITSDKENPATIVAKAGITTSAQVVFSNVIIDATELPSKFIQLPSTAPAETNTIEAITFDNVKIMGLAQALFYSAAKANLITNFNITNSIVEVAADFTVIDFTKGSAAANINIENSTIYAPTATSKSMYSSQGGQKYSEFDSEGVQTFKFANSTIYNMTMGKNFFSHRQANQKWLAYDAQKCIFVNCGKKGQTVRGMNGGQNGKNPTWTIKSNVFNFLDGEAFVDSSADESTGDADEPVTDNIQVVVQFADAANGDFTQSSAQAGDPRWIK